MSWQTADLGTLCDRAGGTIQTGPFGSQLHQSDYLDEGIPVVMPKDIRDGTVSEEGIARISESKANQLNRHFLQYGDIVFPRRGEISKRAFITEDDKYLCGTGCLKLHIPAKELVPKFLYYYLDQDRVVRWIEGRAIGTTMLNLNTSIMRALPVSYPSVQQQEAIAGTLSAYDELIANNRRRVELLKQAARELYKEWFVRLRFPGHEHVPVVDDVPDGWARLPIRQLLTLNYGKALKADDRVPGPCPVYGSSGIVGWHDKPLAPGPTIIVGRKGNVGSVYWEQDPFYAIDTVYWVSADESSLFAYFALLHTSFMSTDVAVPGLNRDFAYSREVLVPSGPLRSRFEDEVSPLYAQIRTLTKFNSALAEVRDLLLPKLMNGELAA